MAHSDDPEQGEAPGEDTNVYVKRLKDSRSKTRRPIMAGVAILAVLLTLMALKFGSHRHEELEMMGPVYDAKVGATMESNVPPPAAPAAPTEPAAKKVTGPPARVDVSLEKGGKLWVDGRELAGKAHKMELKLSPGPHVLMAKQSGRVLTQKITVGAGEVFEVTFGERIRVMRQAD